MQPKLLATAAAMALAFAAPSMAQTANNPLPANPSDVNNATPAAGTPSGAPLNQDATTNPNLTRATAPASGGMGVAPDQTAPAATASQPTPGEPASSMASPSRSGNDQSASSPPKNKWHHMRHAAMQDENSSHWAHQPGTGESGPASKRASNIDSADTHSAIAPHLPQPLGGENAGPVRYLQDAQRALRNHKTGLAQQALEMAETRLLDRSTPASEGSQTDQSPAIQQVSQARKALASGDTVAADSAIQTALATTQGGDGGMGSVGVSSSGSGSMAPMQGSPSQASQAPAAPGGAGNAEAGHVMGSGTGGGPLGTPSNDSAGGAR